MLSRPLTAVARNPSLPLAADDDDDDDDDDNDVGLQEGVSPPRRSSSSSPPLPPSHRATSTSATPSSSSSSSPHPAAHHAPPPPPSFFPAHPCLQPSLFAFRSLLPPPLFPPPPLPPLPHLQPPPPAPPRSPTLSPPPQPNPSSLTRLPPSPSSSPAPPSPDLAPAPPLPPPSCPCSSLLPRLLSAHRMEVRRLLRGALATLSRRLDALERSGRKRRKRRRRPQGDEEAARVPPSPSCMPPPPPPPPLEPRLLRAASPSSSSLSSPSDSEEVSLEPKGRKRRRRSSHGSPRGGASQRTTEEEEEEEEELCGRFVGRMAFSIGESEAPLTLRNFSGRWRETGGRSEKALNVVRRNGVVATQMFDSLAASSSQNALRFLPPPRRLVQSATTVTIPGGEWGFSDFPPLSFDPTPVLRLSVVAVEAMAAARGGSGNLRPLRDWTAPPSLSTDHCYMRPSSSLSRSLGFPSQRLQKPRAGHVTSLPASQSDAGAKYLNANGERAKRVSQIRIRRASPRETPLTPMGLPKVKRLKKKEFSLEEIYTNKNYKSPNPNRSLETIFEEPREKDGALLVIGHQRRRRLLLFPDFTQPRKRKRPQGVGLPITMGARKRTAARRHYHADDDEADLDVMLVERLSALEDFLSRQGLEV